MSARRHLLTPLLYLHKNDYSISQIINNFPSFLYTSYNLSLFELYISLFHFIYFTFPFTHYQVFICESFISHFEIIFSIFDFYLICTISILIFVLFYIFLTY